MPYKATGRPAGRPPLYADRLSIAELEAAAESFREQARRRQAAADERIAEELRSGKTQRQVAGETGRTISHVRYAARRHRRRREGVNE